MGAIDHASSYRDLRTRVIELVRSRDDADLQSVAPATPEWRVHDVLAHLSGVCTDIVTGNLDGVTTDPWTAAQVAPRRDWSTDRLLDEWDEQGAAVEAVIRTIPDLPDWNTFLFDAATHEQDIRGSFGTPGGRDGDPIVPLVGATLGRLAGPVDEEGTGAIRFELDGDVLVAGTGDPATTLRTSYFEVFRAVTGRRSRAQLLAYDWDPEPRPDQIVGTIFRPRATELVE
jgi:uncharacterized protein (TIGR03083 family)